MHLLLSILLPLVLLLALRWWHGRAENAWFETPAAPQTLRGHWIAVIGPGAAISGATTVVGAGIAASWGWGPATLWIVLASLSLGTALAIGITWLVQQHELDDFRGIVSTYLGSFAPVALSAVILVMLAALGPVVALNLGEILATWPHAATVIVVGIVLLTAVNSNAHLATSLAVGCGLIALATLLPIRLAGDIAITAGEFSVTLQDRAVWTVAITLICAWLSLRRDATRSLGIVAGTALVLLLGALAIATAIAGPEVVAPAAGSPGYGSVIALLGVTLTGGAIAGFHVFGVSSGIPNADTPRAASWRLGVDAVLALTVITLAATAVPGAEQWAALFGAPDPARPLALWSSGFILMSGQRLGTLGLADVLAQSIVAATVAAMTLAALVRLIQVLGYLARSTCPGGQRWHLPLIGLALAGGALVVRDSSSALLLWPLIGAASQLVCALMLGCIALALRQRDRRATAVVAASVAAVAIGALGSAWMLHTTSTWTIVSGGHIVVLTVACWFALKLPRCLRSTSRSGNLDTSPA